MNRIEKVALAKELKENLSHAQISIFVDYRNLSAPQLDLFRKNLREKNVKVKVIKNNVARLVVQDGAFGESVKAFMGELTGPTLVTFGFDDPSLLAKEVYQFSKDYPAFNIKESLLGKMRVQGSEIEKLAQLPSKEVLIGQLLGLLSAPIKRLLYGLSAAPRSLIRLLDALEKKKQE